MRKPTDIDKDLVWLEEDWMDGVPWDFDLHAPVWLAQSHLKNIGWLEHDCRQAREEIYRALEAWKIEHGKVPIGLGLDSVRNLDQRRPWECAGSLVRDAVDLVGQLDRDEYPFFTDVKNGFRHQMETIFAVLCIGHAASCGPRSFGLAPTFQDDARASIKAAFWQAQYARQRTVVSAKEGFLQTMIEVVGPFYKQHADHKRKLQNGRHDRNRRAKQAVIAWWEENQVSAAEAGRRLPDWLEQNGYGSFCSRTIERWIGDHARTIGKRLR